MELYQVILVIKILLEGGHDKNCWESSQHNRRENFIFFMINSGKNKCK